MDAIHNTERWIGLPVENIAQCSGRDSDHLSEVLLSEVLVLHQLSDSIFHALKILAFIFLLIRCFISEQATFRPFFGRFYKDKAKI